MKTTARTRSTDQGSLDSQTNGKASVAFSVSASLHPDARGPAGDLDPARPDDTHVKAAHKIQPAMIDRKWRRDL